MLYNYVNRVEQGHHRCLYQLIYTWQSKQISSLFDKILIHHKGKSIWWSWNILSIFFYSLLSSSSSSSSSSGRMSWSPIECGIYIAKTCAQLVQYEMFALHEQLIVQRLLQSMIKRDRAGALVWLHLWGRHIQVCHAWYPIHATVWTQHLTWSQMTIYKSAFSTVPSGTFLETWFTWGSLINDLCFLLISLSHKRLRLGGVRIQLSPSS